MTSTEVKCSSFANTSVRAFDNKGGAVDKPHILCVDNYDSFVYTIVSYIRRAGAIVTVVRNDDECLMKLIGSQTRVLEEGGLPIQGVLMSPGPGKPSDAGYSPQIIQWCIDNNIPMFGVCLGHQGLGEICGAYVGGASKIMHGKRSPVRHDGKGVFTGLSQPLTVARYHSLAVDPDTVPEALIVTASSDDGMVMGFRHRFAPIETVQFHPESIATDDGYQMIHNWVSGLV